MRLNAANDLRVREEASPVAVVVIAVAHAAHESDLRVEVAAHLPVGQIDLMRGVVITEIGRCGMLTRGLSRGLRPRRVVEPVRVLAQPNVGVYAIGPVEFTAAFEPRHRLAVERNHADDERFGSSRAQPRHAVIVRRARSSTLRVCMLSNPIW